MHEDVLINRSRDTVLLGGSGQKTDRKKELLPVTGPERNVQGLTYGLPQHHFVAVWTWTHGFDRDIEQYPITELGTDIRAWMAEKDTPQVTHLSTVR